MDLVPPWADPVHLDGFATEQIGEAGDITADQLLRHYDCPVSELLARIRAGEPLPLSGARPCTSKYSQRNGRVVIQDTRLAIERIGERTFELTEADLRRKNEEAQRRLDELRQQGDYHIEETELGVIMFRNDDHDGDDAESQDLQSYFDNQSRDIDRAVQDSVDNSDHEDEGGP